MAGRTPQEILEQREAWMSRKAARAAGQDIPMQPPLRPGETAPEPVEAGAAEVEAPEVVEAAPEPVAPATAPDPEPAAAPAPALPPQSPAGKRTPEEIRAQREAFMAAKAARAAGQAPAPAAPPPAAPTPAAAKPAPAPAAAKPAAPAPKPAAAPKREAPAPAPEVVDPNITRRELLNYAWLASIGLFAVQTVGLSLWFAFPNFKAGQFGGLFPLLGEANAILPEVNSGPKPYTDGKFWLVNLDTEGPDGMPRKGIMAIFKVCTHLGCLYEWVPITNRFECPCHGSKFALTGDYIEGPARRSLDRFVIQAVSPDGTVKETDAEGNPLEINGDETLIIDTGQRILGKAIG